MRPFNIFLNIILIHNGRLYVQSVFFFMIVFSEAVPKRTSQTVVPVAMTSSKPVSPLPATGKHLTQTLPQKVRPYHFNRHMKPHFTTCVLTSTLLALTNTSFANKDKYTLSLYTQGTYKHNIYSRSHTMLRNKLLYKTVVVVFVS